MKRPNSMSNITENRKVYLTRVYSLSAAHRLGSPYLSDEENDKLYGKCGRSSGHGHNYTLKLTLSGTADPLTGMLADIREIDDVVKKHIMEPLDHKNLNVELKTLKVLTSETLLAELWSRLAPHIKNKKIHILELEETRKNNFKYYGN
ncbi:MAG: 6-carboxytetrahydropterin synthase [bacterium]|nr:6-carboxytetrahydropterin synthase [bacterium]